MATCSIRAFTAAPAVPHRAGAALRPETSAASSSRTRVRRDEVPRPGVAVAVLSAAVDRPDGGDESSLTRVEQDPHLFDLARISDIHAIDQLKTGDHDGLRGAILRARRRWSGTRARCRSPAGLRMRMTRPGPGTRCGLASFNVLSSLLRCPSATERHSRGGSRGAATAIAGGACRAQRRGCRLPRRTGAKLDTDRVA